MRWRWLMHFSCSATCPWSLASCRTSGVFFTRWSSKWTSQRVATRMASSMPGCSSTPMVRSGSRDWCGEALGAPAGTLRRFCPRVLGLGKLG